MFECNVCGKDNEGVKYVGNEYGICSTCYSHFKKSKHSIFEEWLSGYLVRKTRKEKPLTKEEHQTKIQKHRDRRSEINRIESGLKGAETYAFSVYETMLLEEEFNGSEKTTKEEKNKAFEEAFFKQAVINLSHLSPEEISSQINEFIDLRKRMQKAIENLW